MVTWHSAWTWSSSGRAMGHMSYTVLAISLSGEDIYLFFYLKLLVISYVSNSTWTSLDIPRSDIESVGFIACKHPRLIFKRQPFCVHPSRLCFAHNLSKLLLQEMAIGRLWWLFWLCFAFLFNSISKLCSVTLFARSLTLRTMKLCDQWN